MSRSRSCSGSEIRAQDSMTISVGVGRFGCHGATTEISHPDCPERETLCRERVTRRVPRKLPMSQTGTPLCKKSLKALIDAK